MPVCTVCRDPSSRVSRRHVRCNRCRHSQAHFKLLSHPELYQKKKKAAKDSRVRNWESVITRNCRRIDPRSTVAVEDVRELYRRQRGKCFWFGTKLVPSHSPRDPAKPSLDRLDRSKPHSPDNCVLSCFAANAGRNSTPVGRWREFLKTVNSSLSKKQGSSGAERRAHNA